MSCPDTDPQSMWYMQIRMNTHVIYFCMLVFLAANSISLQGYYDEQCSANSLVYLCSLIQRCPDPIFLFFYFLKANLRQTELSFTPKWGLLVSVLWSRSLRENFQISVLWSRSLRRIPNLWSLISISEGKFQKMCMSDRNSVSQLSQSQAEVAAKADSKLKQQTLWLMYRWHLWEIFFSIHQSCSPKDLWVRYTFALFERNFSFRINNTLAAKEEYG